MDFKKSLKIMEETKNSKDFVRRKHPPQHGKQLGCESQSQAKPKPKPGLQLGQTNCC